MSVLEDYLIGHQSEYPQNDNRLLREVAYERLKDAVRYANLQPGEPLSENRISKILGISRTPVREALQMLSQEGLVEIIPGRAVTVASRSIREILDVIQIRLLLEPALVRLATEAISNDRLQALHECTIQMIKTVENIDRQGWSIADTEWHEILSDACPNQLLGELVLQMRNRVHRYANIDHQLKLKQLQNGTEEHLAIYETINNRDAQKAEQVMRTHLENLRQNLFDQLIY